MTDHLHPVYDPTCYRCDLGRDEEISALAEEYHEENIEPGLRASGVSADAIRSLRLRYVGDVRRNPRAVAELYEWAEARDLDD